MCFSSLRRRQRAEPSPGRRPSPEREHNPAIHALPFGQISASRQRGDRDPGRETCELLLPPPGPADYRAERFQADIHVMWRQAELLRRNLVKRLLVYLGDLEAVLAAREPKGVPHSESFGDRYMLRPGKTIRQSVGDPTGAIDEQRRNGWLAFRVPELTDDIAQ